MMGFYMESITESLDFPLMAINRIARRGRGREGERERDLHTKVKSKA
jgi:hypothetical protein